MAYLEVPQGRFGLRRYPERVNSPLRAWDAADEYLLAHLAESVSADGETSLLIVNDSFGALGCALAEHGPATMSDSYLSLRGLRSNLERNDLTVDDVDFLSSLDKPPEVVDVLVFKVPKTLALLEDQLRRIRPSLHGGTIVVGAAMTRHLHTSTFGIVESVLGPSTTSRARKKARLIFAKVDADSGAGPSPYPTSYELSSGITLLNHANVFSRRRLDRGTELLIEHLPVDLGTADVVDVGCGNGVIGLSLASANPDAHVSLIDESFMAVASAEANRDVWLGSHHNVDIIVGDSLSGLPDASVDLVISNPPFHDDHAVGDAVAWELFKGAQRVLRSGGRLLIVGNRHLGYHVKIKRIFGEAEIVASNPKFVVIGATRKSR